MLARRFAISFITFVAFVALSVQVVLSDRGDDAYEVWLADQSDTRPGHGGQLLIYDGAHLTGKTAARARLIAAVDLGARPPTCAVPVQVVRPFDRTCWRSTTRTPTPFSRSWPAATW